MGAQFRGRARDPMAQIMTPYSCSNCAALNSKLHRSKTENGECRVRIDELSSEVAAHSDRVRELEDALRSLRDELAARGKMVQAAKAAESAARDELAYERQKQSAPNSAVAAAALREAELESLVHAAQRSEQTMRSRMEAAEFEARRAVQERKLLNDSVAAAEAEMAREREWARERDANSDQVAAAERAARERAAAAEAACCAAVAEARAEGHAATQAAEAERQRWQRRCESAEAELQRVRSELGDRLHASDLAREQLQHAHDSLEARVAELLVQKLKLEQDNDATKLRTSKLASAVARAQEAEGERARGEEELRRQADEAKAAAEAAKGEAALLQSALREAQREVEAAKKAAEKAAEQMPKETAATMRELLSAVKIAVLAPCLKLHINGAEPLSIGSAGQVDFSSLSSMLEENVLKRFSQVTLLDSETPLATGAGGAHAIFPELRETMASVQEEVRERLVAMMQNAGE